MALRAKFRRASVGAGVSARCSVSRCCWLPARCAPARAGGSGRIPAQQPRRAPWLPSWRSPRLGRRGCSGLPGGELRRRPPPVGRWPTGGRVSALWPFGSPLPPWRQDFPFGAVSGLLCAIFAGSRLAAARCGDTVPLSAWAARGLPRPVGRFPNSCAGAALRPSGNFGAGFPSALRRLSPGLCGRFPAGSGRWWPPPTICRFSPAFGGGRLRLRPPGRFPDFRPRICEDPRKIHFGRPQAIFVPAGPD